MIEPTGRGDEPQVRTTVESSARRPATRQSRSVRSTITSRFSMAQSGSLLSVSAFLPMPSFCMKPATAPTFSCGASAVASGGGP